MTSGSPPISAASVPTWTNRPTPASRAARSTLRVPPMLMRSNADGLPHSPSCAAAWKATSQPCAPSRIAGMSSRSPVTASAPRSRTARADASDRASARAVQPSSARRRTSAPPMNPDPPVTNAVGMGRPYPAPSAAERGGDALARHGALAQDLPLAVVLPAAQVDHRGRRAGQVAGVEDEVGRVPDLAGHVADAAGVGATGGVGAGLQDRPADGRQRLRPRAERRDAQAEDLALPTRP